MTIMTILICNKPQVTHLFSNFSWTKENFTVEEATILQHWVNSYTGIFVNCTGFLAATVSFLTLRITLKDVHGDAIYWCHFSSCFQLSHRHYPYLLGILYLSLNLEQRLVGWQGKPCTLHFLKEYVSLGSSGLLCQVHIQWLVSNIVIICIPFLRWLCHRRCRCCIWSGHKDNFNRRYCFRNDRADNTYHPSHDRCANF